MKIRWPPATKALSVLSWTIMISTPLGSRPAAFQIGVTMVRMIVLDLGVADQIESLTLLRARRHEAAPARSSARQKRVMMRLNTVGTGRWQARNAGRPRQLRNLALAAVLLLACLWQK